MNFHTDRPERKGEPVEASGDPKQI
ncbi:uncharacterized protein G2W53_038711 [Senna tora]|uniref:Uncharacterized protein n=1 Tax=Senna tora TaxID=362788 RepID=A0A834SPH7_9FABA|nr:uncharacterized protein G2W53_038711 [Senna tora]